MTNKTNLLGLHLNTWSLETTIQKIKNAVLENKKLNAIGVNSAIIVLAREDETLKTIINEADINNIDGESVVWALRFLGCNVPERVACPEIMESLLKIADELKWRVFLLGAKEEVLSRTVENIKIKYPNLAMVGFNNGYFKEQDEPHIINKINSVKPQLLFLGLTSPVKELFIKRNFDKLEINFSLGVGGMFDILAGDVNRAPKSVQKMGLEWLYRITQEPGRLWKRYAKSNTIFILLVFREKLKALFLKKNQAY